jgi:RNA polymerase sigma-70 factor (ECF subfamily)
MPAGAFPPTHWSVVFTAGHGGSTDAADALADLCRTYWYPLYAFARREGHPPEDAQDLTQGFFEHLIETHLVGAADEARGKFRTFLLRCFRHHIASEYARSGRRKRGGGWPLVSLDAGDGEARFAREVADRRDPETLYERNWAVALVNAALDGLAQEFERSGRGRVFEILSPFLHGDPDSPPQVAVATELATTEATVRVMVHRLRRRYRELLRQRVAQTVGSPVEVEEELRHLMGVLQN